jgi:hypothetical protein
LPTTQVSILPAFLTKLAGQAGRRDRASNPNPWSSRTPSLFQLRYARLWTLVTRNNSTTDLSLSLKGNPNSLSDRSLRSLNTRRFSSLRTQSSTNQLAAEGV